MPTRLSQALNAAAERQSCPAVLVRRMCEIRAGRVTADRILVTAGQIRLAK